MFGEEADFNNHSYQEEICEHHGETTNAPLKTARDSVSNFIKFIFSYLILSMHDLAEDMPCKIHQSDRPTYRKKPRLACTWTHPNLKGGDSSGSELPGHVISDASALQNPKKIHKKGAEAASKLQIACSCIGMHHDSSDIPNLASSGKSANNLAKQQSEMLRRSHSGSTSVSEVLATMTPVIGTTEKASMNGKNGMNAVDTLLKVDEHSGSLETNKTLKEATDINGLKFLRRTKAVKEPLEALHDQKPEMEDKFSTESFKQGSRKCETLQISMLVAFSLLLQKKELHSTDEGGDTLLPSTMPKQVDQFSPLTRNAPRRRGIKHCRKGEKKPCGRRIKHSRKGDKKPWYTDSLERYLSILSECLFTALRHLSALTYKPTQHVRNKRPTTQKKVEAIHQRLSASEKFQSETNICENQGCITCQQCRSERTSHLSCKVVPQDMLAFGNISSHQLTGMKRSRLDSECCIVPPQDDLVKRRRFCSESKTERLETDKMQGICRERTYHAELSTYLQAPVRKKKRLARTLPLRYHNIMLSSSSIMKKNQIDSGNYTLSSAEKANFCEKQQQICSHLTHSLGKRRRFPSETSAEMLEPVKMPRIARKRPGRKAKKKRCMTTTKRRTCLRALVRRKKRYVTRTFHTKHSSSNESPKTFNVEDSNVEKSPSISDTQVILDRVYIDEAPQIKSTQPPTREEYQFHEPRQVSADTPGRVSDAIGDPPGQQSVYIPPGDVRKEAYRLSTYERFPVACPISRKSLAKSGFYFTGFFDRVKCFACGRTVERWEGEDDPTELRWHKPDCPFPRGEPCGNVPVLELFSRLRLNTQHGQAEQQQRSLSSNQQYAPTGYSRNTAQQGTNSGGIYQAGIGGDLFIQSGTGSRPNQPSHVGNLSAPRHPQRWRMANVISADHRRFLSNLYLNRELDRLTSFARWPMSRPNVSPTALAKSGFFYLGDMDRTQCFSCGGVLRNWTSEDNAQEEHRTHFPSCPMVHGIELRNIPVPEEAETPEQRATLYPCRYSASPHMRSEDARLDTFQHGWQTGRTTATPAEIAKAGFFFLGERDRVKCWYCNGGLQNWEYDDVPWVEHAKWFPNCQFLLQNKGQNYVHHHLSMNPHLARPVIAKQEGATIDPMPSEVRGQDIPPSETRTVTQPSASPAIIDPREEMRKKRERIDQIVANSDLVKNVLTMGFSEEIVRGLIEERIDAGREANPNDIFGSVSELLDAVMAKEAEEMNVEENNEPSMTTEPSGFASNTPSYGSSLGPPLGSGRYNVSYIGDERMDESEPGSATSMQPQTSVRAADESLEEQLRKMEEERMCKICFTNMADMVYIPCGHMCCCMECTRAINKCPVCRKKIEKALKTYAT